MKIRNLTPHTVNFPEQGIDIAPEDSPARVSVSTTHTGESLCGIPISKNSYGEVVGLPDTQDGVVYLVSLMVAQAKPDRTDLVIVNEAIRDESGKIIGAQVGETSLLTRAALALATAAGDLLAGQEGAFGTHLLSREICRPVLMFGPGGRLANEQVEELAGMPGYGLVRAGNTGELLSKEP